MFIGGMVALPLAIQQAKWFGASEAFFCARYEYSAWVGRDRSGG